MDLFGTNINSNFVLKSDGFNKRTFTKPRMKESITSRLRGFFTMSKKIEYQKGDKIGDLIYIKDVEPQRTRRALFVCRCGNEFVTYIAKARSGHTKSCGCFRTEKLMERSITHGQSNDPLYYTWKRIINCCYNKKSTLYYKYGKRGIRICDEWRFHPIDFIKYIKSLPDFGKENYTLDRIDNDGDYRRGNLRWTTKSRQQANRRPANNKYGFTGVKRLRDKWQSRINVDNQNVHLGTYDKIKDAVKARDSYIIENDLQSYYKLQL